MHSQLLKRLVRRLFALLPKSILSAKRSWRWLAYYPTVRLTDNLLKEWNSSHWEEYQRWLERHSLQNVSTWELLEHQAKQWQNPPKISIVTPVFNTAPEVLYETILSVRAQTYPYWQFILVDDASTHSETRSVLRSNVCRDPRIQVIFNRQSQGISGATNVGIKHAQGDYVIFLDHDDRLSLEALSLIAAEIARNADLDIIYSDRDMISEKGKRYLHVFKPDWSPESLLSGNYLFHLMCYRRQLLLELGGLRSEYDGSQDYDLILRAAEIDPKVCHIAKILYHWRQHAASVALNVDAKDYAFRSGVKALNAALERRGINGCAKEIPHFWRGTYQIDGLTVVKDSVQLIKLKPTDALNDYAAVVSQTIASSTQPFIAILSTELRPESEQTLYKLAAWLNFEQVGLVTGKILNSQRELEYVGMAYQKNATLIYPYRGFPQTEPGYLGITQLIRNISAPHPFCVLIRRSVWQELRGFNPALNSPFALLDFALRALQHNWRTVIVPQCRFENRGGYFNAELFETDQAKFQLLWQAWLKRGDPYYNQNLAENSIDMGLDI